MDAKPKVSLEDLVSEVNKVLHVIQNHKGPLPPEVLADFKRLKGLLDNFHEDIEDLIKLGDIDINKLKEAIINSPDVKSNDKQLIKQSIDLEKEARVIELALSKAMENNNEPKTKTPSGNKKKQQIKERKKLFKTIGGDKNWIPM